MPALPANKSGVALRALGQGTPCGRSACLVEGLAPVRRAALLRLDVEGRPLQVVVRAPAAAEVVIRSGRAPLCSYAGQHIRECVGLQGRERCSRGSGLQLLRLCGRGCLLWVQRRVPLLRSLKPPHRPLHTILTSCLASCCFCPTRIATEPTPAFLVECSEALEPYRSVIWPEAGQGCEGISAKQGLAGIEGTGRSRPVPVVRLLLQVGVKYVADVRVCKPTVHLL